MAVPGQKIPIKYKKFLFTGQLDNEGWPNTQGTLTFLSPQSYFSRSFSKDDYIIGHFIHGKLEGESAISYVNGKYIKGNFVNNQLDGQGESKFPHKGGSIQYIGSWKAGRYHGQGLYISSETGTYEGEFVDNKRSGLGQLNYINGNIYKGNWALDKKHGLGQMIYANGDHYEGLWNKSKRSGLGTLITKAGLTYTGEWSVGNINSGTLTYPNGNRFVGDFNNFEPTQGTLTYINGNTYKGDFSNHKPNGQGTLIEKHKRTYIGHFQNGIFTGPGQMVTVLGQVFTGEFQNWNLITGQLKSNPGYVYTGQFKQFKMHGFGQIVFDMGTTFKGQFQMGHLTKGTWTSLPSDLIPSQLMLLTPEQILPLLLPAFSFVKLNKVKSKLKAKHPSQSMKLNIGLTNHDLTDWQRICQHLDKNYQLIELQAIAKTHGFRVNQSKRKLCQLLAVQSANYIPSP